MIFLIVNAVLSAILFLIVILPPLYIYNPDKYPGESNTPPSAGEVIPDEEVTHAVKQKLYLLFIIPTCAAVNAIFLYFAYYRPIRFIHYRVELNLLTLRLTLDAGRQQLQKSGVLTVANRSMSGAGNFSMAGANTNVISRNLSKGASRSFAFDGAEQSRQKLASSVNWEWRRHARPKSVRKDAWVNSAVFAEISELRDEVEQRFLLEGGVVDANFAKAVVKTLGVFVPTSATQMLEERAQPPPQPPAKSQVTQKGFYNSSRPPLMALGGRTSGGDGNNNNLNNTNSSNNGNALNASARRGFDERDELLMPQRATSVLMVPTETSHRRSGNGNNSSGSGNVHANSSGVSGAASSALRFFKGGHRGHHNSSSSNNNSGGGGSTGNRMEQASAATATPVRRDAFEPVTVGDMSPLEPPNDETAVRSTRRDDSTRNDGEGSPNKPGLWNRLWGKGESKES